jgi:hypothetical protein
MPSSHEASPVHPPPPRPVAQAPSAVVAASFDLEAIEADWIGSDLEKSGRPMVEEGKMLTGEQLKAAWKPVVMRTGC